MKINRDGLALVKSFEGLRLQAYDDARPDHKMRFNEKPIGTMTIGYGHTKNVHVGQTCTEEQAEKWLIEDLAEAERAVETLVEVELTGNEFSALVSGQFNAGYMSFRGKPSTLRTLLNKKRKIAAAKEMMRWVHVDGEELPGLVRRRQAERELFLKKE